MRMKSSTKRIRELLEQGYAYSEVHEITGFTKAEISAQGLALEAMGVPIKKKTDEEMKKYLLRTMNRGHLHDIINSLTLDEVQRLMAKSMVSWADAITKEIKEKTDASM